MTPTWLKYIQLTRDDRRVVKIKGTNIVLSDDDIDKVIAYLQQIKSGEAEPLFTEKGK